MRHYTHTQISKSVRKRSPFSYWLIGLAMFSFGNLPSSASPAGDLIEPGADLVEFCARFWIAGNEEYVSKTYMSEATFLLERDRLHDQRYRLKDLEIRESQGRLVFSALWEPGQDEEMVLIGLSWPQLEQTWEQVIGQGLILSDLESYTSNGERFFAGVWRSGENNQQALLGPVSRTTFNQQHQVLVNQDFHLRDFEIIEDGGTTSMMGVWDYAAMPGIFLQDMPWNTFHKNFHDLNDQNYRLSDFESYLKGDVAYYTGVWYPSAEDDLLVILDSSWDMDQFPTNEVLSGYTLVDIEMFMEDSEAESSHEEPEGPVLVIGKSGGVIITPGGPVGTLMPLHNGGSTGPGN